MPLNLGLTGALYRRRRLQLDVSAFDGGTIKLYSLAAAADAGDLLAQGTLPSSAFENEDVDGNRAKHGAWSMVATKNGTARGLFLSSADGTTTVFLTVTESGGGGDIIIDNDDIEIDDVIAIATLIWDTSSFAAPQYTPGVSNLIFAGDASASFYTDLTTAGATPIGTAKRFVPQPSPSSPEGSSPVDPTTAAIITGKDGVGKAIQTKYAINVGQQAPKWWMLNGPTLAATKTHYFRVQIKLTGTGPNAISSKFFHWNGQGLAGGDNPQWSLADDSPFSSAAAKHTWWDFVDGGFTDSVAQNQCVQPFGPYVEDLSDGLWHEFLFVYRPHASSGNRNGIQQMWIDDVLIMWKEQAAVGVTPAGGEKTWCSQQMIDNGVVNILISEAAPFFFGGTSFRAVIAEWTMAMNLGDGDATNHDTLAWWTD